MSPVSQTVARSFAGEVELEGQPVLVSVGFADGLVHLRLGGEPVGSWPLSDVEFKPRPDGRYELQADGDSICFQPHQPTAFGAFIGEGHAPPEPEPTAPPEPPSLEPRASEPAPEPPPIPIDPIRIDVVRPEPPDAAPSHLRPNGDPRPVDRVPDAWAGISAPPPAEPFGWEPRPASAEAPSTAPTLVEGPLLGWDDADETEPAPLLGGDLGVAAEPEPLVTWETETDDYFAAGLNGPTTAPTPGFRSGFTALAPSPAGPETEPEPPAQPVVEDPEPDVEPEPALEQAVAEPVEVEVEPEPEPVLEEPQAVVRPDPELVEAEPEPEAVVPEPVAVEPEPVAIEPEPVEVEPDTEPEPTTGTAPTLAEQALEQAEEAATPKVASALAGLFARFVPKPAEPAEAEARQKPAPDGDEEHPPSRLGEFFKVPEPADDSENLRQWIVVVAGGLALVVLLTIIILGLTALFSSDEEPEAPTATTVTTAAPAPAEAVVITTTTESRVASASSVAEMTDTFIADWNNLAKTYAFNLAIEADSLPVSTVVTRSIHLAYTPEGPLVLSMTPEGNGTDRDLLIAMGMAVAWADPSLSADQRKELMAALGIDVTNPDLSAVGGEITVGSVTYRAGVAGEILKFEAARTS